MNKKTIREVVLSMGKEVDGKQMSVPAVNMV